MVTLDAFVAGPNFDRFANEVLTIGLHWGVLIAGALVFVPFARRHFRAGWFVAALILYGLYDVLLTRALWLGPDVLGGEWAWTGKTMSLVGMMGVAALPAFGWSRVGLTLRQRPGAWLGWAVLGALTVLIFGLAVMSGDGVPDNAETIAFQWTMPGLDEELAFRGVLLLALNEAFGGRVKVLGAPIGWGGVLTCVLFGAIHGLGWNASGLSADPMTMAMTGGPAVILLWLRERTGSLVAPILGHNVVNGAFTLF